MRPSLVIGLGGTGSWTNLYLKRRLLADHRWRLLGQDPEAGNTSAYDEPDWDVWLRAVDVDKENRPAFSQLRLDGAEDIGIGADVGDTIEYLKNTPPDRPSPYPTIEAWLSREEAKRLDIGEAVKFMTTGAGQIRQFGRIAFFLDVLNKNVVLGRLEDALARLTAHASTEGELTTYVTASVAGGTGAGLLLDVLAYLQAARRKLPGKIPFRTIVFLVLPGAFKHVLDPDQHTQAQANGMATLRELDRGINAYDTIELEWQLGSPMRLRYASADVVYLVDGSRDSEGSRQLEGYSPPEEGLPIAIADAIYAHMFPSSGHALTRGYPNLILPQLQGGSNRYSSFGSYVIEFAWEPLLRSFTLRATGDLLTQLLAPSSVEANGLAEALLDGRSTDRFTSQGQQEPLPFLLTDVLAAPEAARGGLAPSTSWLEPRSDAAPFPQTPALADAFPDLGLARTEYTHDQVIKETEALLERFWGSEKGRWTDGDPQFHPVANSNIEALEQKWERALYLAAAAVMSLHDAVGGVEAGLAFLDAVDRRLDRYCGYLDETAAPNLTPYQEAVDRAKEKMQRGRWFDIPPVRQRAYIDAAQDLLQQQVTDECLRRARALLGRFRHTLKRLEEDVAGWRNTLQALADTASEQVRNVDDERKQADRPPQRRTRPLPGDAAETRLYTDALGPRDDESPLPERLHAVLQTLSWDIWTSPSGRLRITLKHPTHRDDVTTPTDWPRPITLDDLNGLTGPLFARLREVSVFEVLEAAGERADDLAAELRREGAPLASVGTGRQLEVTGNNVQFQDWDLVIAGWRAAGPGADLSQQLRRRLEMAGMTCEDLAALPVPGSLPAADKIIVFRARHLIALDAFNGVALLEDAYRQRRSQIPSPHLFPEEKSAARLEAVSESLHRDGHLPEPLGRMSPLEVVLCRDLELLQYTAAAIAGDLVDWQCTDPIKRTGNWVVTTNGKEVIIGTDEDLGEVLARIMRAGDHAARQSRQALEEAGRLIAAGSDRPRLLEAFVSEGSAVAMGSAGRVLRVAAAILARHLSR